MEVRLDNKTALVCGSTQGIGKCIATEMANSGATVILLARNEEKLKTICENLPGEGHQYWVADFSDNQQVQAIGEKLKSTPVDILVNNTGGPPAAPAHVDSIDAYLSAFKMHLINNQILVQASVEHWKNNQWGRIINVISTSVKQPLKGLGVSNTVRGAVGNWAKTLAMELGPFGVTVNNVLPGATNTERLEAIFQNKMKKLGKTKAEIEAAMLAEIPAARFGKPEELAYAATFLASDKAAYINGTNVVVDGGRTSCL